MERVTKNLEAAKWPHNLTVKRTLEMSRWLYKNLGHGDVFFRDNVWMSSSTEKPLGKDAVYFFWGPGCIQFKYEEDMVKFVLRFA